MIITIETVNWKTTRIPLNVFEIEPGLRGSLKVNIFQWFKFINKLGSCFLKIFYWYSTILFYLGTNIFYKHLNKLGLRYVGRM